MFKSRNIQGVEFCRDESVTSIEVRLSGKKNPISLFDGIINHCSKKLSESEMGTVIEILTCKKEVMLREDDFPVVYGEMLKDLIIAYNGRYGKQVKKDNNWKPEYGLNIAELEEVLRDYYNLKEVRVNSIYAGNDSYNTIKMEVESPKGFLILSFSRGEEDE